tara:strand:+ start:27977 stop:28213 length:237 start_codon:yes stop_codon:yes gene_type:complete
MDYRFLVRDEISSVVFAPLLYRVLINRGSSTAFYNVFFVRCFGNVILIDKGFPKPIIRLGADALNNLVRTTESNALSG